jgi:hypothetical protein
MVELEAEMEAEMKFVGTKIVCRKKYSQVQKALAPFNQSGSASLGLRR